MGLPPPPARPSFPAPARARGYLCMDHGMTDDPSEVDRLLRRAAEGDAQCLGALLERHGARLRRMVALRLDPRLQGRIAPSDVIQETYLEVSARLAEYVREPTMP